MMNAAKMKPEGGRQLSPRDRILGLALVVGIVALLFFLRTPEEPSPVADLLLPPEAPLETEWFSHAPETTIWTRAQEDYTSGHYMRVAEALESVSGADGADASLAQLVVGSCYLLAGRTNQAELELRLAARSKGTEVGDEARWRLAVSLLRQEDVEEGRAELESLAREGGPHADAARVLLQQLGTKSSRVR